MYGQTVLLRAVQGLREGWKCMSMDEFLKRIDLNAWDIRDELVGIVLPPSFTVVKRSIYCRPLVRSTRRR
jgi:hypothetical protein